MSASSLEWLTVSSEVVATGKVLSVNKVKGPYAVVYENYVLDVTGNIKGAKNKETIEFTIRAFSTHPVFGKIMNISDEVIVFLSPNKETEKPLKDKLVPTSNSFPLSIINLNNPGRHIIDINFNVLKRKAEIVKTSRQAQRKLIEYKKQNPQAEIKSYSVDVPMGTKAFGDLYAGSACYLVVPNFLLQSIPIIQTIMVKQVNSLIKNRF
jgi:hypothetical protein